MPVAVFKSVREFSSEDGLHVAQNLLKENAGKKWKTQSCGEKSAYVILEFEEAQKITGVDIGNEHSAFIEVQVSRTGCGDQDFKELLLSSSFMNPIESKNSSNPNRVRCFNKDAICADTLSEKWKLVKIICTQPFNKHIQYGLSFIKVHVIAVAATSTAKPKSLLPTTYSNSEPVQSKISSLGNFKMRAESMDSDSEAQNSLFQRWKASRTEDNAQKQSSTTTAAAIRDAAQPAALRRLSHTRSPLLTVQSTPTSTERKLEKKPLDRNREALLFGDDSGNESEQTMDKKKQRLSKHIEADKSRLERDKETEKLKSKRHSLEQQTAKTPKVDKPKSSSSLAKAEEVKPAGHTQKRLSSPVKSTPSKKQKTAEPNVQYRPFNQLLSGVVLVISGIQNPDRADLRNKALALGAKYKTDWERGCTHLICAFKNTPKYNQVKGKGKIVARSWIEKCYALKKYLPWRRYALDTADLGEPESDVEILDESLKPAPNSDNENDLSQRKRSINTKDAHYESEDYESLQLPSGSDTEDELERVAKENKARAANDKKHNKIKEKDKDIYEVSTDEEDFLKEKKKQQNTN